MVADPELSQSQAFARLPSAASGRGARGRLGLSFVQSRHRREQRVYLNRATRAILLARSKLKVAPIPLKITPVSGAPDGGHKTMRAGLGMGWREGEFFNEANFRLAFHDLLDPEYGYTPGAQIQALGLTLRHYPRRNHTRLEKFTLLDILSLSPVDALFASPSWRINAALDTIQHNNCRFCRTGNINGGIGAAAETSWLSREVYFGFADLAGEFGSVFNGNHRLGGGLTFGAMADISDRWKFAVSGSYLNFPLGDKSDEWRISAQQRYTLLQEFRFAIRIQSARPYPGVSAEPARLLLNGSGQKHGLLSRFLIIENPIERTADYSAPEAHDEVHKTPDLPCRGTFTCSILDAAFTFTCRSACTDTLLPGKNNHDH